MPDGEYVQCPEHGRQPAWIVCTHVLNDNATARLVVRKNDVGGEMLCTDCIDRSMKDDAASRFDVSFLHAVCQAHLREMTPHLDAAGNVVE